MREEAGKEPAAAPGGEGSITGGSDRERGAVVVFDLPLLPAPEHQPPADRWQEDRGENLAICFLWAGWRGFADDH